MLHVVVTDQIWVLWVGSQTKLLNVTFHFRYDRMSIKSNKQKRVIQDHFTGDSLQSTG